MKGMHEHACQVQLLYGTSIDDVLLEEAVGALLVVGDDELMTLGLEPLTKAELVAQCV